MLFLIVLGVLLWIIFHLFPSFAPARRQEIMTRLGSKYQAFFALGIVLSIVFMVIGWKNTLPEPVYNPPSWGRHLTMLLMIVSFILFGAANTPTRLKTLIRHPMLAGVLVWSIAHLLANGDIRSVVLFGGLGIWAVVSQITINRRDGEWQKPEQALVLKNEIILVVVSLVIYAALVSLHGFYTGMPLIVRG